MVMAQRPVRGSNDQFIARIKETADCRQFFQEHWKDYFREKGNSYCPFHEDNNASLQLSQGMAYCHAEKKGWDVVALHQAAMGTTFQETVKTLAQELGLGSPDKNGTRSDQKTKPKIVATYDYTDEAGELLFQVVRFDPKGFRQRRPDGKGGWNWNLEGVQRVIYNLPRVLKSSEVFICEGEKDCDALNALGLTATTSPQGAGKWLPEYCRAFDGVEQVAILPDNDEPGRKHALDVAGKLFDSRLVRAQNIKILELPGLPPKGDVSDWLASDHDHFGLQRLAREAFKWTPGAKTEGTDPSTKNSDSVCLQNVILEVNDFLALRIPEKKIYLYPWLTEQSIIYIIAWRGVGKTGFVLGAIDALTKGQNFGPWTLGEPVNCLYLDGEMAAQDVKKRLQDLGTSNRVSKFYIYSDAYAHTLGLPKANLLDSEWRDGFQKTLLELGVKVWVCDNLASLSGGIDENSKEAWDPIGEWLLQLRFAGITSILIHHENKSGGQRGTSAREDHADVCISLKKPADYSAVDGARFIASFTKSRIETEYLPLIADVEFQFMNTIGDVKEWTWKGAQQATRAHILKNLDDGLSQSAVADLLNVSKGQVSKVRTAAIKGGWMTPKNRLTQLGISALEG